MKINKIRFFILLFLTAALCSCQQESGVPLTNAAYVRFFNGITYYAPIYNTPTSSEAMVYYKATNFTGQVGLTDFYGFTSTMNNEVNIPAKANEILPPPLVAIFIDPTLDADGLPVSGYLCGDFVGVQNRYYPPQPYNLGDPEKYIQYDYPGQSKVERAPLFNHVDLSGYVRVPSGKHRVMVVYRPLYTGTGDPAVILAGTLALQNRTTYTDLSQGDKMSVLNGTQVKDVVIIDQDIDFSAQKAYTLKLLDDSPFNLQQIGNVSGYLYSQQTIPHNYKLLSRVENFRDVNGNNLVKDSLYVRILNHTNDPLIMPNEFDVYHRIAWYTKNDVKWFASMGKWVDRDRQSSTPSSTSYRRYSALIKIATVSGRYLQDDVPYIGIPSIPMDSLLFPDGSYMIKPTITNDDLTQSGIYQFASNFGNTTLYSKHQIFLVRKGTQVDLSLGSPAINPNLIAIIDCCPLQITEYLGNGSYQTKNVANTIEINTKYRTYTSFDTYNYLTLMGNFRLSYIQNLVR
jgi:hypothetical protein